MNAPVAGPAAVCETPLVSVGVPGSGSPPAAVTVTLWDVDAVAPPLSVTVSVTVYVPAVAYACVGFAAVDVPPSPNAHERDAMLPSLSKLVSVKEHERFVQLLLKLAIGAWLPPLPGEMKPT